MSILISKYETNCTNFHISPIKIKSTLCKIALYQARYRSRKALEKLSPEQLKDIGLSQEQAIIEAKKPFWK